MIVTGTGLMDLVLNGAIDVVPEAVFDSHIDVTLGPKVLLESSKGAGQVNLALKEKVKFVKNSLPLGLEPGEFALFELANYITVPSDCTGEFYLDSSLARAGLEQSAADLLLPGWEGILTLELKNITRYHELRLGAGMPIGKVLFHKHNLTDGYVGRFQNQSGVST